MAEERVVLFSKGEHFAALSLYLSSPGAVVGFGAGKIQKLAAMFAAGRSQPVYREFHGTNREAIAGFSERVTKSISSGWTVVYTGEPNFG